MLEPIRSTAQRRDDKGDVRHGAEWLAIWSDPDSLKTAAEKRADQHSVRMVQDVTENIAAAVRSVSGRPDLEVRFGSSAADSATHITLPRLDPDLGNLAAVRGACDAKASFLRHHDPDIAAQTGPDVPDVARLMRLIEINRCTAIAARKMPGMTDNLIAAQIDKLQRASLFEAHLASLIPLAEAVQMVTRDSFHRVTDCSLQTAGFRMWDQWLRSRYQVHFDSMNARLEDQAAFANSARLFLDALLTEISANPLRPRDLAASSAEEGGQTNADQLRETDNAAEAVHFEAGDALFLDAQTPPQSVHPVAPPAPYRAFSTAHDRIVQARDLTGLGDLRATRQKLDEKLAAYRQETTRLVGKLQRRLMAKRLSTWHFDLEEGLIDAARLDRVVVNPGFENAYKNEAHSPFRDTCVTLLIDNSGSMRGKQIETACVVADIVSVALERCGIATEILGFTTAGWKGGKSAKDWARAGKPENPGRLNDILHIIYKDGDTPLRRARDTLCAMLHPSILKENIDGEALLWAESRLMARPEGRKLLIVLSDGAPVDQATLERNTDADLLDRHLRHVVHRLETRSPVALCAIGIKHDVGTHYTNAIRVDDVTGLAQALVTLIDTRLT